MVNTKTKISYSLMIHSVMQNQAKFLILLNKHTLPFWYIYIVSLGDITSLSFYYKIIISMHLFKLLEDCLVGSPLRIKSYNNASITFLNISVVYWRQILWHYYYTCHWNHFWKLLYSYITWYTKVIHVYIIGLKLNWLKRGNTEYNGTSHMFTTNLSLGGKYIPFPWAYQLLLRLT